jgi:predicted GIY-YIG superfamily endonuclease
VTVPNETIETRRAAVYRLYDAEGTLLYIGSAYDPADRSKQHRAKAWWPQVTRREDEWHPSRWTAYTAETQAIQAEKPRHNVMGTAAYRAECRRRAQEDPVRRACIMAGVAAAAGAPRETVDAILRQEIGWQKNRVVPLAGHTGSWKNRAKKDEAEE